MMKVKLQQIKTNFTGEYCYTHARGVVTPQGFGIITTQPLRISGCDVFYGMEMMTSTDGGHSWSEIRKSKTLTRTKLKDGYEVALCDATPFYHRASGKILLTGHSALYLNDNLAPAPRKRYTIWSVYDEEKADWTEPQLLNMPDEDNAFFSCGNGCGQIIELDNGDVVIPVYFMSRKEAETPGQSSYHVMLLHCSFDGKNLKLIRYGNSITVPVPRGLGEPSITQFNGRYFIALRNDQKGYVTSSTDGLTLAEPQVLCFDDGSEAGNYCTQQHWFKCGGKLFMVYTRRGANNDHVFRHRAPLFFAEFDPEKMCLIRATEQIAVPERGARLGNFGCAEVNENEALVIASEWMQTNPPNPRDWRVCASYGSDNSIFIARITPQ